MSGSKQINKANAILGQLKRTFGTGRPSRSKFYTQRMQLKRRSKSKRSKQFKEDHLLKWCQEFEIGTTRSDYQFWAWQLLATVVSWVTWSIILSSRTTSIYLAGWNYLFIVIPCLNLVLRTESKDTKDEFMAKNLLRVWRENFSSQIVCLIVE